MRDIGDVIADLSGDDSPDDVHLYSTLAPVYDFAYERHFDYDEQLRIVTETVPERTASVLEVGTGTGRLLARLAAEYETAVGMEASEAMARRARARLDDAESGGAEIVVGDATRHRLDASFDAVVSLGRVTGHFTGDGAAERFVENSLADLGGGTGADPSGGVLLFDYFPTERMEDDYETTDTFESETYRVERDAHATIPDRGRPDRGDPDVIETEFDYEIVDRETGERAAVSETMPLRMFGSGEVRDLLRDAGFAEVAVREEAADGWPLAVAHA